MSDQRTNDTPSPNVTDRSLETIRTLGRLLDDIERVRIMNSNRIGALERAHGESLPHLLEIKNPLDQAEHLAELELVRAWRKHPLAPWAKGIRGVGEKSIARLIAEIGDPAIGTLGHWETSVSTNGATADAESNDDDAPKNREWIIDEEFERTVSQLWAYCGVGDPARNRIPKGAVQSDLLKRGKPRAKKQLYLIGTSLLKSGIRGGEAISDWGQFYMDARVKYSERIHDAACPPCHAAAGDPWKPGHQHMAALRLMEKHFLKELWKQARTLRGLESE
jgi:hypothetical protein